MDHRLHSDAVHIGRRVRALSGVVTLAPGGTTPYASVSTSQGINGVGRPGLGGIGKPTDGSTVRSALFRRLQVICSTSSSTT
jgi:hypothetical protein